MSGSTKQLGTVRGRELGAKGGNLAAWPAQMRVRDFPPSGKDHA